MPAYDFGSRGQAKAPSASKLAQFLQLDMLGLDMVSPTDLMKSGRTPYAKNFRLYAQQSDDRQVAVSNRKGSGFYLTPLSETKTVNQESVTGASTHQVGAVLNNVLQKFVAADSNRVTRLDVKLASGTGTGAIIVELWSSSAGVPYKRIATSSIQSGDVSGSAAYVTARFIQAPKLVSGDTYFIVLRVQDDGTDGYTVSTTTNTTLAYVSNTGVASPVAQTFSINYKLYTTAEATIRGVYRWNRDNGANMTIVVIGTTMYKVDETTHTLTSLKTGLSGSATYYSFTSADNKLFWANSYDALSTWDGTLEATNSNLVTNGAFETNITGWAKVASQTNTTVTRTTGQFHGGAASMDIANAGALMSGYSAIPIVKNHTYHITYWAKVGTAANVTLKGTKADLSNALVFLTGSETQIGTTLAATTSWQQVDITYTATEDMTYLFFSAANGAAHLYVDDIVIKDTGFGTITDAQLEVLSQVVYHKDRLFGVSAANVNKFVWSEAPGNPTATTDPTTGAQTATTASSQWYNEWKSTSFQYAPRPFIGSPITSIQSFQDSLFILTQDGKYVFSGYDTGSYTLRESTGFAGAVSRKSICITKNFMYFVGKDGFWQFDGTKDTKISEPIEPLFRGLTSRADVTVSQWRNQVRFYIQENGSAYNNACLIYHEGLEELQYDTDTWVQQSIPYGDTDDSDQLVEISSVVPTMYIAEVDYNNLGMPIDFEYRFNYTSLKSPAQKKRIKKFFPLLQGVDTSFPIVVALDRDFQDSPRTKIVNLTVEGGVFGQEHELGDGLEFSSGTSFKMHRLRFSGYGNYWQIRVSRKAVNNRVALIGAQFSYKTKRI
jgi:hypothetical protein